MDGAVLLKAKRRERRPGHPADRTRPGTIRRFQLHAPAGIGLSWSGIAAWTVVAAAAVVFLWVAFRLHVVGDYSTESDFYGGYIEGARLFQAGLPDPSRYSVAGPGYDAALALLDLAVRDFFVAARLLSVASAVGVLALWRSIWVRRIGPDMALWGVAFLAVNPVFTRYAYSATTDMFSIFLQAAAIHALLASTDRHGPFRFGCFAALATLTRYNSIYLVPFGVAHVLWIAPRGTIPRGGALFSMFGGFALFCAPWVILSLGSGHLPGSSLVANFTTFYMVSDQSRNVQDQLPATADSMASARSFGRVAARAPLEFAASVLGNVPNHLLRDGIDLLGKPVAITAMAGLALAIAGGFGSALLPIWLAGALLFATLIPVFSSDRYSLALAPMYLTMAAAAAVSRHLSGRIRGFGLSLKWIVLLLPLVLSVRANFALQQQVNATLPVEVLAAAAALEKTSQPGDRVMTRKAHIGYYAGRPTVAFPRLGTLAELGIYCRARGVDYIYFSWYEARLRPEFIFLIDSTAVVPGLTRVFDTARAPSVLYRVGPEFGSDPPWFRDARATALHRARGSIRALPAPEAAPSRVALAAYALDQGRPAEALAHLRIALPHRRDDPATWELEGHALRALGRMPEAIAAYRNAIALDPGDVRSRQGIDWAQRGVRGFE